MIPAWVVLASRWVLLGVLLPAVISGAIALALSFAGPRQRRIARILWPVAALGLWVGVCLFMAAMLTGWPAPPREIAASRLAVPAYLAVLGGALAGYGVRWAVRGRHHPNRAKVAA